MDLYIDWITTDLSTLFNKNKDRYEFIRDLDKIITEDSSRIYMGTDASAPVDKLVATAAYIYSLFDIEDKKVFRVGKATSTDAELYVISKAISKAVTFLDMNTITIFSDLTDAIKKIQLHML